MKEEKKKNKKKVLLTYLGLAACLLIIAAVTLTVCLTVNRKSPDLSLENPNQNEVPDDSKPGNSDNKPNSGSNDDNTPANTPEAGYRIPVDTAVVSTRYEFAHNVTLDQYRVHQGLDFECEAGEAVCAVLDGTVTKVVTDSNIGENYVTVSHKDGITSTYKYIDARSGLKVGDAVKRGDILGTVATAGGYEMKQSDHLHFEMSVNGKSANPETYLDLVEK